MASQKEKLTSTCESWKDQGKKKTATKASILGDIGLAPRFLLLIF